MSEHEDLIRMLFDAMNSREFSSFEKVITDDVAFDFPGVGKTEGARRILLLLNSLLRKYPELTFTTSDVIVQSDRACALWTNAGKDSSGDSYSNSGVTLFHFRGDKISFISDYFKDTSFVERTTQHT
jgi:ketosteroid isomerase-like protein